jgi:hypothetical protein
MQLFLANPPAAEQRISIDSKKRTVKLCNLESSNNIKPNPIAGVIFISEEIKLYLVCANYACISTNISNGIMKDDSNRLGVLFGYHVSLTH